VFQGASLGSILLLMALGLAVVFGLMGVINMAHGELMALGAYATFVVQNWFRAAWPAHFDSYFLVALPVSFWWRQRWASSSSAASSGSSTGGRWRRCC